MYRKHGVDVSGPLTVLRAEMARLRDTRPRLSAITESPKADLAFSKATAEDRLDSLDGIEAALGSLSVLPISSDDFDYVVDGLSRVDDDSSISPAAQATIRAILTVMRDLDAAGARS